MPCMTCAVMEVWRQFVVFDIILKSVQRSQVIVSLKHRRILSLACVVLFVTDNCVDGTGTF